MHTVRDSTSAPGVGHKSEEVGQACGVCSFLFPPRCWCVAVVRVCQVPDVPKMHCALFCYFLGEGRRRRRQKEGGGGFFFLFFCVRVLITRSFFSMMYPSVDWGSILLQNQVLHLPDGAHNGASTMRNNQLCINN